MSIIEAIILGIVQGLAEFLPISSSGHLVMLQKLFGMEEGTLFFDTMLHLATLIPVIYIFRKEIYDIIKKPFSKLTFLLVAGTIPTVIIALLFNDFFETAFQSGTSLGIGFILTGLVLWHAENIKTRGKGFKESTYLDAGFVGVAQGIAILPAISRSGFTIAGSLIRGFSREFAMKFSFLLSIPAILGAGLKGTYDILKADSTTDIPEILPMVAGMLAAAFCGYIAIKFMIKVLTKGSLKVFSWYVFLLGFLIIIDQLFFGTVFTKLFP